MAVSVAASYAANLPTSPYGKMPIATMSPTQSHPPAGGNINVARTTIVGPAKTLNSNSLKEQCFRELSNHKSLTAGSLDFLLAQIAFPVSLKVRSSAFLSSEQPIVEPRDAATRFLAPVHHVADQGHWSLVYVVHESEPRHRGGRNSFRAQHYDSCDNGPRAEAVKRKLERWVRREYGGNTELRFEQVSGPQDDKRFMSGLCLIMAAREFAKYDTVGLIKPWSDDPRRYITGLLQGRQERRDPSRQARETPSSVKDSTPSRRTEAHTTPSPTPSTKKKGDNRTVPTFKQDLFTPKQPTPAPEPRVENGVLKGASPLTKALARKVTAKVGRPPSCGPTDDTRSEPRAKRRRVESEDPLTFSVKEKSSELISFASELGLPAVASLKQERDKLVAELEGKRKAFGMKNEALDLVNEQYEQHSKEHSVISQEYESLNDQIKKKEKSHSVYIAKLPLVDEDMGVTDNDILNSVTARFQQITTPLKNNLKGKLEKKRKASEMLESAGQEVKARQADLAEAVKEKIGLEFETREACKREEMVAILEDAVKKLEVWKEAWKDEENWLESFLERRGRG
ncbi:hypothetical protein FLONG3_8660 [Fusarium longipes]|uniref:Uncharacterized protein n=1 Tax=Fusarium longipes TaxID=694270 RepID=A0A395S4G7_9HYPO|nr:hypothetical protein FLONG3_8660 [Fusarium longipes]